VSKALFAAGVSSSSQTQDEYRIVLLEYVDREKLHCEQERRIDADN